MGPSKRSTRSSPPPTKILKTTEPDSQTLFLLSFHEHPSLELVQPSNEDLHKKQKTLFKGCIVHPSDDHPLVKTHPQISPVSALFLLKADDFVFVRPSEDNMRPSVARIHSFIHDPQSDSHAQIAITWFYRGEDLGNHIPFAVGEDEVFETSHSDTVEAECVVGRCFVSSYPNWVEAIRNERGLPKLDIAQSPSKRVTQLALRQETTCDVASDHHEASDVLMNSTALKSEDDDDDSGNYEHSSLHLYCRLFYEPALRRFFDSEYENEAANPTKALKFVDRLDAHAHDADFVLTEEGADNDEEFEVPLTVDEVLELTNGGSSVGVHQKQRPNGNDAKSKPRRKSRISRASFALPSQLGTLQKLPCRDGQKARVRGFLQTAIESSVAGVDASRCLYISGVPGTGKTATVREVVYDLRKEALKGKLPSFTVVEVNAMTLSDPSVVYTELYAAITGRRDISPMHAAQLLEGWFCDISNVSVTVGRKRSSRAPNQRLLPVDKTVLVILDEMDVLLARKQKVLYDVLEWPTRPLARMVVIGIANTMDLPERMLPRLGSRLGLNRLVYPPYTRDQIETILKLTLDQSVYKLSDAALRLCAAKIGAVSGDVRRATELCRRAMELVAERVRHIETPDASTHEVSAQDMQNAIQESLGNFRIVVLQQLALVERLALVAAIDVTRRQGVFEIEATCSVEGVCERAIDLAGRNETAFGQSGLPSTFDIEEACWRLAGMRMVIIEKAVVPRLSRVIVNVSVDDCKHALEGCKLCNSILTSV